MKIEEELRKMVRGKGLRQTARELGIDSGSLYRSILDGSNVGLSRVDAILKLFGYELKIVKRKEVKPLKPKPSRSRRNPKKEVV
jgi:DNA-binding phage protein